MIVLGFFLFLAIVFLSWAWVNGIDNMKKNHPDYKGEDFLSLDDDDTDWLG
jgi:hypothetical protein